MWQNDQYQHGSPELAALTPETEELRESGYISSAQSLLMQNETTKWDQYTQKPERFEKQPESFEKNGLSFDVSLACDSGFYISGTSQSGKTNLAKCIVQKLLGCGISCYVLDSSKAWSHDSPIKNALVVDTKIDRYLWQGSTVFDISTLGTRHKVLFVNQLCHDIYAMHVDGMTEKEFIIFEEAQTYLPQGCMRLATRKSNPLESVLDVVTVGANYGLRFGLITQFPALVDKSPVKICQQRYFGWTWERNDVNYVKAFIGKEWAVKLQSLQKGEFIYQCRDRTSLIKTSIYGRNSEVDAKGIYRYDFPMIECTGAR